MAAPTLAPAGEPTGAAAPRRRNGEIEGVRALAALAVLFTHVSLNAMGNRGPFGGLLARLDVGVAVFFVVSGYLLYRPFAGAILRGEPLPSVRRYLRHRLVRIVPAYWLVVVASFLFAPAVGLVMPSVGFSPTPSGSTHLPLGEMAKFVTFTQVYWKDTISGPFPQAWTLAVEMAFYLLLPLLALLLARVAGHTRAARLRQQWVLLGGLVVTAQLFRLAMVFLDPAYDGNPATTVIPLKAWLPNHLDLFAIGMLAAVWTVESTDRGPGAAMADRVERLFARRGAAEASWLVALGSLLLAGYGLGLSRTDLIYGPAGEFTRQACYALTAAGVVAPAVFGREGGGPVRWFLRTRPMVFLGTISYGIYLWQIIAIGRWASAPSYTGGVPDAARHPGAQFNVAFWPTLIWTLVVTVALATITWFVVEKPWMRFRDRRLGFFTGGVWTVALASFATRVWGFSTVTAHNPGNGDPFFYHAQANMLADGVGFGEPIRWLTERTFVASAIHPPAYTLWLTPSSLLGARGFVSHKTMAAIAGTLVVVVAALLVRRLAGDRAGVLAAVLVALYPNLWIIDGTMWPEGLYTATIGAALIFAYRWRDEPSLARAAAVGGACGVAILTRGEALLLLPLLCLPLAWAGRDRAPRWLLHGAVMGAVALGVIAPWTIRNFVTFHEPVAVSTNSDEVLYYANCPDVYSGPFIGYWSFGCQQREREARVAAGLPADPPGNEAQRAKAWGAMGREYAMDHKRRLPYVGAARLARVWDLRYADNNAQAIVLEGRPHDWSRAGLWVYRLIALPGLVGLWLLHRRGARPWPLVMMVVMVSVTAVYAYGHIRFRTAGDLVLLVGAAVVADAVLPSRRTGAP